MLKGPALIGSIMLKLVSASILDKSTMDAAINEKVFTSV
jgi:hypothetical protein